MKSVVNYTEHDNQFYPTPKSFLKQICDDFSKEIKSFQDDHQYDIKVLEPSAGKGDIADYLKKNWGQYSYSCTPHVDVECVELDTNLRAVLKDKGYPVVYDDFLAFNTYTKYDLIFMNPPFADAEKHLLKAISMQEQMGGKILCILNAETLRNLCARSRTELAMKISDYKGKVRFYENAFCSEDTERKTAVEVAVVWLDILAPESLFNSKVFDELDRAQAIETEAPETEEQKALIRCGMEWIKAAVRQYNEQIKAAVSFFKEYVAFTSKYNVRYVEAECDSWRYTHPFSLEIYGEKDDSINRYIEVTRRMYWKNLFDNPLFSGKLTSRLRSELSSRLDEFSKYDFNEKNVLILMEENMKATVRGIEQEILDLFDRFTKHAQYDGCENVHYYNGWKTNSAHRLNKKIIIPFYGVWEASARYVGTNFYNMRKAGYEYRLDLEHAYHTLSDMSMTLNYLSNGICNLENAVLLRRELKENFDRGNAKNIETQHFILTFYKKGTCHIKFKNQDLLDKFNLFASQRKGWLPPSYGQKHYDQMTEEEQAIIEEFQGKERYEQIMQNKSAYIVEASTLMMLASGE